MTLAPLIDPSIRGVEGKPGDVKGPCRSPGCSSQAQQRHHLWPRSYLQGQPYEWVSVNGVTLQNTVGLCVSCHSAVTGGIGGHRAHIKYDPAQQIFDWWAIAEDGHWFYVGPLKGQELIHPEPEAVRVRASEGLCVTCGRPKREPRKEKPGPKRKVSTWGVSVPDDAEIGSDILDDWIESFAILLGFGEAPSRLQRYHVLALILPWADQHRAQLVADLEEAGYYESTSDREEHDHAPAVQEPD